MSESIPLLNGVSSEWFDLMLWAAVRSALAFVVVSMGCRLFRQIPPVAQCWLWRLAYATPLVALFWPWPVQLPLLPASPESAIAPRSVARHTTFSSEREAHVAPSRIVLPIDFAKESPKEPESALFEVRPASAGRLTLTSWLLLTWSLGVAFFVLRLGRHWRDIRRLAQQLEPVTGDSFQATIARVSRLLRLRERPPLLAVPRSDCAPFLIGIRRPAIVLPQSMLKDGDGAELEMVFCHELAHLRRHDLLWNWLPRVVEILFFFHPLVWLSRRPWRLAQEMAADELALSASGIRVEEYANRLLAVVGNYPQRSGREQLVVAMSASFQSLNRRLTAMKTYRPLSLPNKLFVIVCVASVGIVGVVPWKATARGRSAPSVDSPTSSTLVESTGRATQNEATAESDQATGSSAEARELDPEAVPRVASKARNAQPEAPAEFRRTLATAAFAAGMAPIPDLDIVVEFWRDDQQHRASYVTDEKGIAELELPTNRNLYWIRINAHPKGLVPIQLGWNAGRGKVFSPPAELTLRFESGVAIGGTVNDETGTPVEGASVEIHKSAGFKDSELALGNFYKTLSDRSGRWQWDAAPPDLDDVRIDVTHPDYANKSVYRLLTSLATLDAFRQREATFVLVQGISVAGRVRDENGNPLAGARVAVGEERLRSYLREVKTGKDGRFTVKYSKAGPSVVTVEAEGYSPELRDVVLASGMEALSFDLQPPAIIRGLVVDPDGKPISGAFAAAASWRGRRSLSWRVDTDREGRFVWESAPHDAVLFDFGEYGYAYNRGVRLSPQDKEHVVTLQREPVGDAQKQTGKSDADTGAAFLPTAVDASAGDSDDAMEDKDQSGNGPSSQTSNIGAESQSADTNANTPVTLGKTSEALAKPGAVEEAVSVLQKLGARLERNDQGHVTMVGLASRRDRSITDADVVCLRELGYLEKLILTNTHTSGRTLEHIREPKRLRVLIVGKQTTDEGLERLRLTTNLRELNLKYNKIGDASMRHLEGLKNLESLWLHGTDITDVGLRSLQGLTKMREMSLPPAATEKGLAQFAGLTNLERLNISRTQVTDDGLAHLKGFSKLWMLMVANVNVTDEGLMHLSGLTSIERMTIEGTRVTDAGLEHLKGLTKLKYLGLKNTDVTDDGVKELIKALPNCRIDHDEFDS